MSSRDSLVTRKRVVTFDRQPRPERISEPEEEEQSGGKGIPSRIREQILRQQKRVIEYGQLFLDSTNQGIGAFLPEVIMENLVRDYEMAENLYGQTLLRRLTGYEPGYIKKNLHIPEFVRELRQAMEKRISEMKKEELLTEENDISETGMELASFALYLNEMKNLAPSDFSGLREHRERSRYGVAEDTKIFQKERYQDLSVRKSVKVAVRRGHDRIIEQDLRAKLRKSRGRCWIVYGLDASGSMRGEKIDMAKRAGVALAYQAMNEQDRVGLIVFGSVIKEKINPTSDFRRILHAITRISARNETNIHDTIIASIDMFPQTTGTKHLILLTDALPTKGPAPEESTLRAASVARSHGITISIIGINLDKKGGELAQQIAEIGSGRLYTAKDINELDLVVLEEYERVR